MRALVRGWPGAMGGYCGCGAIESGNSTEVKFPLRRCDDPRYCRLMLKVFMIREGPTWLTTLMVARPCRRSEHTFLLPAQ